MNQSRSNVQCFMHLVWTTKNREAFLTQDHERAAYRCITDQAIKLECSVLAIGGMPDHVHLLLQVPAKHSIAQIVNQIKGISSSFARDRLGNTGYFRWQEGYGGFSLTRSHLNVVKEYINHQKEHHALGTLLPDLEPFGEDVGVGTSERERVNGVHSLVSLRPSVLRTRDLVSWSFVRRTIGASPTSE